VDDSIHYAATTKGEKLWLKVLYTRLIPRRLSFSEIRFETTRPGPQSFPDPAVPIVNSKLDENMEFAHSPSNLHTDAEPASSLAAAAVASFKSRTALQLENLALRHQLGVLRRSVKRPKLITANRLLVGLAVPSLG